MNNKIKELLFLVDQLRKEIKLLGFRRPDKNQIVYFFGKGYGYLHYWDTINDTPNIIFKGCLEEEEVLKSFLYKTLSNLNIYRCSIDGLEWKSSLPWTDLPELTQKLNEVIEVSTSELTENEIDVLLDFKE